MKSFFNDVLFDETPPGALRTKAAKDKTKSVMPRRFRSRENRFWGRHNKLKNLLFALVTFSFISGTHLNALSAQTTSRPRRVKPPNPIQVWELPSDRWAWEIKLRSDFGYTDAVFPIDAALNAVAGMLLGIANFIWLIIRGLTNGAFSSTFINDAGDEMNRITAAVGGWLSSSGIVWVIVIAVIVMAVMQGMKGATNGVFKTVLGAIIPIGLLFFMVNASITAENLKQKDDGLTTNTFVVGSPGWVLKTGINLTNTIPTVFAATAPEDSFSAIVYDSPTLRSDKGEFAACKDYVSWIHRYNLWANTGNEGTAILRSSVSSLWERAVLMPWIDAQFGQNNDIGVRMFCHVLEQDANVAPVVRWELMKRSFPGIEQRVPGARHTERISGDNWKAGPGGESFYAPDGNVQHVDNKCTGFESRRNRLEITNGANTGQVAYFKPQPGTLSNVPLGSVLSIEAASGSNGRSQPCSTSIAAEEQNVESASFAPQQGGRPRPNTGNSGSSGSGGSGGSGGSDNTAPRTPISGQDYNAPENILKHFDPGNKDDNEANWTAFGWCKWKKNVPPSQVFSDPGDTEFTNVWEREDAGGKRKDIGVNEEQSCNQWWDFGTFAPRTTKLSDGIFKFTKGETIGAATTKNGVKSGEAANFIWALNGHTGTIAVLMGFYAIVTSFFYGFALIGLALYVLLAQIQLFIALAMIPLFLAVAAVPHPKAKAIAKGGGKMILVGLFAKTFAIAVISLLLFIMGYLTLLLSSFGDGVAGGGGWGALWTTITPLVALFAIRKIPGVKEMTTIRGAIKGTKQRIASTVKGGGAIGTTPKKNGFLRNAARTSARSFGYGLVGASPYAARNLGSNMREAVFNKVRGRKGGKTKKERGTEAAGVVAGKKNNKKNNEAPPPPPGQGVQPNRPDVPVAPTGPQGPEGAGSGAGQGPNATNGSGGNPSTVTPTDGGWTVLPSGLEVPSSYVSKTGKPKGDARTPTQEEVARRKAQAEQVRSDARKPIDPNATLNDHVNNAKQTSNKLEQMSNPDTVVPDVPSGTKEAKDSAAVYADVAGGAAHQDNGQAPAAPQTVFSTIDETGREAPQRNSFDAVTDAASAGYGMGQGPSGMYIPGQQQQQQQGQIFVGAPGQTFASMMNEMNADATREAVAAEQRAAATALRGASEQLRKTAEKSSEIQTNAIKQGNITQQKNAERINQSLKDLPRKGN